MANRSPMTRRPRPVAPTTVIAPNEPSTSIERTETTPVTGNNEAVRSEDRANDSETSCAESEPEAEAPKPNPILSAPSRRAFLGGAGALAAAGLACSADDPPPEPASHPAGEPASANAEPRALKAEPVQFSGAHQLGVLQGPQPAGLVASFDLAVTARPELAAVFGDLSDELERIMNNERDPVGEDFLPPADSGAIDNRSTTSGTAATVAVGASLFDQRFGLADRRPSELIAMPRFRNDRLVRPELSHGDLALTITGASQQAAVFSLHRVLRRLGPRVSLRWVQEGYNELLEVGADQAAPTRNLMGFRDGTSNPDTGDDQAMSDHVWVGAGIEPAWTEGGTYQAIRTIRMLIEFWATAALVRQEQIFGRHRGSGAPIGQALETDEPAFASDPSNLDVPPRSHIRRANPRSPGTARILRRGFSYLNGSDSDGTLDQGLLFIAFQKSLQTGFLAAQSRLEGEPLEDYVKPVGGGLFFVLPGPGDGWLGQSLLA